MKVFKLEFYFHNFKSVISTYIEGMRIIKNKESCVCGLFHNALKLTGFFDCGIMVDPIRNYDLLYTEKPLRASSYVHRDAFILINVS